MIDLHGNNRAARKREWTSYQATFMELRNALKVSGGVSVVVNANASMPSGTPAGLTDRGSRYANTIHSYPTRSARFADLRDHAASCTPPQGLSHPMPWRHLTPYRGRVSR